MLQSIRFLLLLLALVFVAGLKAAPCGAQEGGDRKADEKTDDKKAAPEDGEEDGDEEDGDEEDGDEEDGEKPDEEEPGADEPDGEKPAGEKPAGEKPAGEKPAGEKPAGEKPDAKKPDGEKKAPATPGPRPVPGQAEPPVPTPAGMTYIEGGRAWIGSDKEYLNNLLAGRPPDHRKLFLYETPYHPVFLRPYFISRFEITNAQYERFLADSVATYDTASGSLANIDEIAAYLVGLSKDQQKNVRQMVWRQLYFANKQALWDAFKALDKLEALIVRRPDGSVDEIATARKFRFEPLPRTLKLKFLSICPPTNWPDMGPPKGEADHPVRYISYNDLERFAEWAGMHIPTEAEWEWAARGPEAPKFPWGNNWPLDDLLANWGGKITNEHYEPTTLPVDTRWGSNPDGSAGKKVPLDGDGRSWCGCHHMVGNVAEWTSSWFQAYPGNRFTNSRMGEWVKVIRGGGAGDGEMLVLRPACRNYIGGGADAPPYPENSFEWCGGRLAAYMQSGRDQLGPVVRRVLRPNKVKEQVLDLERFVGTVTRNWVDPSETPENHVYVRGRSHAIVLIPQKEFLREQGLQAMIAAWKRPARFKTVGGLAKETAGDTAEWLLGALHTDVTLDPVEVRRALTEKELAEQEKRGRRGRGKPKPPPTAKGKCAPGTYLLGVWFGKLCLLEPNKEFVCFLPLEKKQKSHFTISKVKPEDRKAPLLAVDAVVDWADLFFDMPVGGKGMDPDLRLAVNAQLKFAIGELELAGSWVQEDPAKALVSDLWAKWLEAAKKDGNGKKPDDKKPDDKKPDDKKPDGKKPDDKKPDDKKPDDEKPDDEKPDDEGAK